METLRFGYRYFRRNLLISVFAEILSFAGILAELLLPLLSGFMIDFVIRGTEINEESGGIFHFLLDGRFGDVHTFRLFWSAALVFLVMVLIRIVFIYIRDLIQEKVGLDLETDLRYATYDKLMELDSDTISDYNSGELLQILNSDTIMFKELFCHRIPYLGDSFFMIITVFVLIAYIDVTFVYIPLVMSVILVFAIIDFKKKAKKNFSTIRKASSAMNLTTQENIGGVRIVRSFVNEELEKKKFKRVNLDYCDANIKQINLTANFEMTFNTVRQIAYIGTIILASIRVMNGDLTVGFILSASSYVVRFMSDMNSVNNNIFNMQQQIVSGLELKHFMEKESVTPDKGSLSFHSGTPDIELKDVCLDIEGQKVLDHITLSIPYGKKIGIVGETGSGKSILIKTILRIKEITSGSITIDGSDIRDYPLNVLRDVFSCVFQDVFLFSNTIESNIAFSRPHADQKLIREAAVHAKADGFINELEERYQTIIGERGIGISGGQKQRISIARCFLKNAPVFVLDDLTSALDVNTERLLLQEINEKYSEKTLIISAHRLSSVTGCDEIIYMREGRIEERGSFDKLMKLNGSFARVYKIQMEQKENKEVEYG
ncbi:MAG: ABC transporter ATP-binding protein/permease [Lachnospiraceae bacterium]|nr:ABC transporter ATP-binding protein/permease [Lachnospiraceae bacterium]